MGTVMSANSTASILKIKTLTKNTVFLSAMVVEIYAFFYFKSGQKRYFYVGRSKNLTRRMREHKYRKTLGHEDKYEEIRRLEASGVSWFDEVIETVPEGDYFPDAERWHVIRLTREGHDLMNMRHGSVEHRRQMAEQVRARHIRSISDVRCDRLRRKFQESKRLRRRIWIRELRKNGIPDLVSDAMLPRLVHRKLLAQNRAAGYQNSSFARGWKLDEFVRWIRRPLSSVREFRQFVDRVRATQTARG